MLTIITPTYNRERLLPACYTSLIKQTDKRFVWMIVDDGSTDNTELLVNEWKKEGIITIVYLKKENGGKASALNLAFKNLTTEFACCLDSDDIFADTAVELALSQLVKVRNDALCCGILAVSSNLDGTPMGGATIPKEYKTILVHELLKLGSGVECIRFYKTAVVRNYAFPEFPGEKFVSPVWLDHEINRKYYFVPSHDIYCLCEYQPDGLTVNKSRIIVKNPHGYTAVKRQSFELATSLKSIIKHGIMYNCGCIIGKDKTWLKRAPKKVWALFLRPFAWVVYIKRFRKIQKELNKK